MASVIWHIFYPTNLSFSPDSFGIKVPKTPNQLMKISGRTIVIRALLGFRSTMNIPKASGSSGRAGASSNPRYKNSSRGA